MIKTMEIAIMAMITMKLKIVIAITVSVDMNITITIMIIIFVMGRMAKATMKVIITVIITTLFVEEIVRSEKTARHEQNIEKGYSRK